MNRRQLLVLPAVLFAPAARAAMPRVQLSLLDGGFAGDARLAGLALALDEGWKTYWRMPGEAGVPPAFDWSGSANLATAEVLYPLPARFADASGDTVGYKHEVVFPLRLFASEVAAPLDVKLALFLGVCKDVCVPLHLTAATRLEGEGGRDAAVIRGWLARVPVAATDPLPVSAASLVLESGKPSLILSLARPVSDIFVEGPGSAYYRKPDFAVDRRSARIVIDNVKDGTTLRGQELLLTIDAAGRGLEQRITLA